MTIKEIANIKRKENFIYYRQEFIAQAKYAFLGKEISGLIEFVLETEPTGKKNVTIKLVDQIDYPLLPILQALKNEITLLDKNGELP